jgi:hypothetical protein
VSRSNARGDDPNAGADSFSAASQWVASAISDGRSWVSIEARSFSDT